MSEGETQAVMRRVWPAPARDAVDLAFREALTKCATEICHETGDIDTWVEFCAETISAWLLTEVARS